MVLYPCRPMRAERKPGIPTMCPRSATSTATAVREVKPRRSCRWVYDRATTLRLLEDRIPAPLTVVTGRGQWTYLVLLDDDGSYTMSHTLADDSGCEVYRVRPGKSCTCPASRFDSRPCKHASALYAALEWLAF